MIPKIRCLNKQYISQEEAGNCFFFCALIYFHIFHGLINFDILLSMGDIVLKGGEQMIEEGKKQKRGSREKWIVLLLLLLLLTLGIIILMVLLKR